MGKRKSSKKPQTRVKQVLDKSFRCIFCAHQGSVTVKLDNKNHVGRLDCKDCGQTYTTDITHLDEAVDVYSAWIDAASAVNAPDSAPSAAPRAKSKGAAAPPSKKRRVRDEDEEDEEDAPGEDEDEAGEDLPDLRLSKKRREVPADDDDDDDDT
ncbi:hypothetical protein JCM21900_003930 [Sporobolomyces salmonicolor]